MVSGARPPTKSFLNLGFWLCGSERFASICTDTTFLQLPRNIGIAIQKKDCALPGSEGHLSTIQGVCVLAYLRCCFFIAEC